MTAPKFDQPPAEPRGEPAKDGDSSGIAEGVVEARLPSSANSDPVSLEPGDLPSSYGRNRLVLLPVDPYIIHVYWDLASATPPAAGARPVLRFYESAAGANGDRSRPFDVDVDFTISSWYVNLWSPDKVYYAEIGWKLENGSFIQLARSNTVRTPPAWPRPADPIEAVASPPAVHDENAADVTPEPPPPPVALPATPSVQPPIAVVPQRADATAHLQRKLAELFAIRGELPPLHQSVALEDAETFEPVQEIPGEPSQLDAPFPPPWTGLRKADLTELSEERFTPGVSSRREGPFGE